MNINTKVTNSMLALYAEQIENALTSHDVQMLHAISGELEKVFKSYLRAGPPELAAIVHSPNESGTEFAAYQLGQLSFGHMVVAQASERRACNQFADKLLSTRYRRYVSALASRDLNGVDLATAVAETEETVSRKMKELRLIGAADFRKEGTKTVHFLTPAALGLVDSKDDFDLSTPLMERLQTLPAHMQEAKNFAVYSPFVAANG